MSQYSRGWLCYFTLLTGCWSGAELSAQPPGFGPNQPDQKLVSEFDSDNSGWLNKGERQEALQYLQSSGTRAGRRGPRGRRGRGVEGTPGESISVDQVRTYPHASFYDPKTLRTLFFEFESPNWEKELEAFKPTDIEVPAKLTVDGRVYEDVGVSFRGASSFFTISEGLKRSLNVSIDFIHDDQRLYGYKSLNLLNCNGDPSMMSSMLYSRLASEHIPVPKVNYVRVVINGENWGLYVSSQQFNKTFIKENFDTKKGARWKVHGSPRGNGGLVYFGEQVEDYREHFEIKSKDKPESWQALINLCRVLNETPADQLDTKLTPILDIDSTLWFLALDVASVNSDGYWTRASDYNLYLDHDGKFHVLPHDMNEAFSLGHAGGPGGPGGPGGFGPPGGRGFGPPGFGPPGFGPRDGNGPPGFGPRDGGPGIERDDAERPVADRQRGRGFGGRRGRGGPGGGGPPGHGGVNLDPMVGVDETTPRMPLRSRLLKNEKWKRQYLQNVRTIAQEMQWQNSGPWVSQWRALIENDVKRDTRRLVTNGAFASATSLQAPEKDSTSLRAFLEQRSKFLLEHPAIRQLSE